MKIKWSFGVHGVVIFFDKLHHFSFLFLGAPYPPFDLTFSSDCKNRNATLTWVTGKSNNASITHFLIEGKSTDADDFWKVIANVTNPISTSYPLVNMTGLYKMAFRIRAVNRFGPSRPSKPTSSFCPPNATGMQFLRNFNEILINLFLIYCCFAEALAQVLRGARVSYYLLCSPRDSLDPRALLFTEGEKSSGEPRTKCLLIGVREEQSKASLIGAFMLARGVSRRRKVQIAKSWL